MKDKIKSLFDLLKGPVFRVSLASLLTGQMGCDENKPVKFTPNPRYPQNYVLTKEEMAFYGYNQGITDEDLRQHLDDPNTEVILPEQLPGYELRKQITGMDRDPFRAHGHIIDQYNREVSRTLRYPNSSVPIPRGEIDRELLDSLRADAMAKDIEFFGEYKGSLIPKWNGKTIYIGNTKE